MNKFFLSSDFVLIYILVLHLAVAVLFFLNKKQYVFEKSVAMIAFFMFGYTVFPLFLGSEEFWFRSHPPSFVSRIVFIALFLFCAITVQRHWRQESGIKFIVALSLLGGMFLLSTLASQLYSSGTLSQARTQFTFATIFCCFLLVAGVTAYISPRRDVTGNKQSGAEITSLFMIISVTVLAFMEVAYDLAPVKNMMRGTFESRASSVFHNPNWYALAVAPAILIACKAAHDGQSRYALLVFGLCSLTFILSGSRSAIVLVTASLMVLVASLARSSHTEARSLVRIMSTGALGAIAGSLLGFVLALGVGYPAPERYVALLERVAFWPIYFFIDLQAQSSLAGRFTFVGPVVDNAYIYFLQSNILAGVLLVILMACVLLFSLRNFLRGRTFDDALRLAAATFVVGGGLIGQVYWAFPVWPIFALTLGYVMHPFARMYFSGSCITATLWPARAPKQQRDTNRDAAQDRGHIHD